MNILSKISICIKGRASIKAFSISIKEFFFYAAILTGCFIFAITGAQFFKKPPLPSTINALLNMTIHRLASFTICFMLDIGIRHKTSFLFLQKIPKTIIFTPTLLFSAWIIFTIYQKGIILASKSIGIEYAYLHAIPCVIVVLFILKDCLQYIFNMVRGAKTVLQSSYELGYQKMSGHEKMRLHAKSLKVKK